MSDDFEDSKRRVKEKLKIFFEEKREGKVSKFEPTNEQIIKAIIGTAGCTLTPEEVQAERDAATWDEQAFKVAIDAGRTLTPEEELAKMMTTADYDNWVESAFVARINKHIQLSDDGVYVEHPTTRLFKIGIESIRAGKPSPFFLSLLEEIANRAGTHDVLSMIFPEGFPRAIGKTEMSAADNNSWIADEYRRYVKQKSEKRKNPKIDEITKSFKIEKQQEEAQVQPWTINRALEAEGLNFIDAQKKEKNK